PIGGSCLANATIPPAIAQATGSTTSRWCRYIGAARGTKSASTIHEDAGTDREKVSESAGGAARTRGARCRREDRPRLVAPRAASSGDRSAHCASHAALHGPAHLFRRHGDHPGSHESRLPPPCSCSRTAKLNKLDRQYTPG